MRSQEIVFDARPRLREVMVSAGFMVFLFLNTWGPGRDEIYTTHSFAVLVVISTMLLLIAIARETSIIHMQRDGLLALYMALLLLMLVPTVLHAGRLPPAYVAGAINAFTFQAVFLASLLLTRGVTRPDRTHWLRGYSYVIGLIAIAACIVAIQLLLTGTALFGLFRLTAAVAQPTARAQAWFPSPNTFANVVALGMFGMAYLAVTSSPRARLSRTLLTGGTFFLALSLLLSGSRGGVLAAVLAVIAGAVVGLRGLKLRSRSGLKKRLRATALAALAGTVVFAVIWFTLSDQFEAIRTVATRLTITDPGDRANFWRVALQNFARADLVPMLVGHGNGHIQLILSGRSVHSGHIELLVNHGLIAYLISIAIYLIAMWTCMRLSRRDAKAAFLIASSMTYILLRTVVNAGWMSAQVVGFCFIALLFGLGLADASRRRIQSQPVI